MLKRCMGCMEQYDDKFGMCPHCGYCDGDEAEEAIHIDPGTLLHNRYIIGKVIGYGGFGVTYIGWDGKLEIKVAIKEYFPSEFSSRIPGQSAVTVFNGEKHDQFYDGLEKFVDEAKRLAQFQSENGIVKVFDSFTENSTAYIIMEYLEGETLGKRLERDGTIPESEAVRMLLPVMNSLKTVHAQGIIHRDIAPDNIFITKGGDVKLIDFGASRYATTSHSRSLTVVVKQGYSPEEQYRSRGDQGSHTDVYALAATLYRMITGKVPPDAMERRSRKEGFNKEILVEPHIANKSANISPIVENAILNAMNVRIEDRTPDIPTFIAELTADKPAKRRAGKIKRIDVYRWPIWLKILVPSMLCAAIVFGTLIATGVISFKSKYTTKIVVPDGYVVVPDVENLSREEAVELLQNKELLPLISGNVQSEYIDSDTIVLQTPPGESYMQVNSSIELILSSGSGVVSPADGKATMPYVIGDLKDDGIAKIVDSGLAPPDVEYEYSDSTKEGCIISTSTEAGTLLDENSVVTIVVSRGAEATEMPDLVGSKEEEALQKLKELKLVSNVTYEYADGKEAGIVLSQSIAAGDTYRTGDSITITVSTDEETVTIPDVTGKDAKTAQEIIEKAGLKAYLSSSDTSAKVESQSPKSGEKLKKGDTVVLNLAKTTTTKVTTAATTAAVVTTTVQKPQTITVRFDADGGSVSQSSMTVTVSSTYGTLPTPTKAGYSFSGWYSDKNYTTRVTSATTVTSKTDQTLYAMWIAEKYTILFDANGGTVEKTSRSVSYGYMIGSLPVPTRNYYNFIGWFTSPSSGTRITKNDTMGDSDMTLYAHWELKAISDWVPRSEMPAGAQVTDQKWKYDSVTTKTSYESSMSGWTLTGSSWEKSGSGTYDYASFPSGFDTNNGYYSKYNRAALTASTTATTKREINSDSFKSYIYWHWCYPLAEPFSEDNRVVSDTYNEYLDGRGHCTVFDAFEGTDNPAFNSNTNAYEIHGHSRYSYWWVPSRVTVKTQTYTDYKKLYTYSKSTAMESSTKVTEGGSIQNVVEYVRYREK